MKGRRPGQASRLVWWVIRGLALGLGLGLALPIVSCKGGKKRASPPVNFELVSSGAKKGRRLLLYRFKPGAVLRYRSTQSVGLARAAGPGRQTNSLVEMQVINVTKKEALVATRLLELRGVPDAVRRRALKVRGAIRVTPTGRVAGSRTVGKGVVARGAQRIGQGLRQTFTPLPRTKVGVGAKWRARSFPSFPGPGGVALRTKLEAHYELKSFGRCGKVRCAKIGVDLVFRIKGSKKKIAMKGRGRGGGDLQLDLDSGYLLSSKIRCSYTISVRMGGRDRDLRLVLAWETKRAP